MKRALFSLCAVVGLALGFCSKPHEIHAAVTPLNLDQTIENNFTAGFRGDQAAQERNVKELPGSEYARRAAAWPADPAYPVEQRTCVGCHETAK